MLLIFSHVGEGGGRQVVLAVSIIFRTLRLRTVITKVGICKLHIPAECVYW